MKNNMIKVIKRKDVAEKTRVAVKHIKGSANKNLKIVEAVNGWIFDLEKNRGKEKVFSSNKILSWELLPNSLEKAIG